MQKRTSSGLAGRRVSIIIEPVGEPRVRARHVAAVSVCAAALLTYASFARTPAPALASQATAVSGATPHAALPSHLDQAVPATASISSGLAELIAEDAEVDGFSVDDLDSLPLRPGSNIGDAVGESLPDALTVAVHAYHEGRFAEAREAVVVFLGSGPGTERAGDAHLLLGLAELRLGQPNEAAKAFATAAAMLDGATDYARWYEAHAWLGAGQVRRAVEAFEALHAENGESRFAVDAQFRIAAMLDEAGRTGDATRVIERLVGAYPRNVYAPSALIELARLEHKAGQKVKAVRALQRVLVGYPTSREAKEAEKQLAGLKKAGVAVPTLSFDERYRRVRSLFRAWHTTKATSELAELVRELRKVGAAHADLYERVLARYAETLAKSGSKVEARKHFGELLATARNEEVRAKAAYHLALVASDGDDNTTIGHNLLQVAEKFAKTKIAGEAHYLGAWHLAKDGHFDEAIAELDRFGEAYPKHQRVEDTLWQMSWLRYRVGRLEEAEKGLLSLSRRVDGGRLSQQALYFAAKIRAKLGDRSEAARRYEQVTREFPVSYYTMLAESRLREMATLPAGAGAKETQLAALGLEAGTTPDVVVADEATPFNPEGLGSAKDSFHARNAAVLLRLGFQEDAAAELDRLKAPPPSGLDTGLLATYVETVRNAGDFSLATALGERYFARIVDKAANLNDPLARVQHARLFALVYPEAFEKHVRRAAHEFTVPTSLVLAIMREESRFRPAVRSPVGALGLMQVMPATGRRIATQISHRHFNARQLTQPEVNVRFGTWYLGQLLTKFNGTLPLAIAGYNAGPNAVTRWIERSGELELDEFVEEIPYKETRLYVKRVMRSLFVYARLYGAATPLYVSNEWNREYGDNVTF